MCRRVQLLHYLGETGFTAAQCRGTCDTCMLARGVRPLGEADTWEHDVATDKAVKQVKKVTTAKSYKKGKGKRKRKAKPKPKKAAR